LTTLTDVLFNMSLTGHCMGGCGMADSPAHGVVDSQNRVFGYENLMVCDGSVASSNLGVNPSLTIAALTELAMSHIPAKPAPAGGPAAKSSIVHKRERKMTLANSAEANLLAQPLRLGNGAVIPNRLAKASMSEALGSFDNHPGMELVRLYGRWAESGVGLMMTGNVMIDRRALGEPGNVVIEDEADLPILQKWAEAATRRGASVWVQLNHPGKQATKGLNKETIAPSAVPFRADMAALFATPREITRDEIQDIIKRFGRSAAICKKAGFSGVEIHAAHGYLINQFLSPHHNLRTDEWGGSSENRRRFMLEVYAEIRRQVGPEFPVGIKLNSADFQRGGFTEEESIEAIRAIAEAGIDLIEISGGTYETGVASPEGGVDNRKASTIAREAYFLEFAEKVRAAVNVPLMVTGGFRTAEGMNAALRSGALDLVGVARILAIDPDAPKELLEGRDSKYTVKPVKTGIKSVDSLGLMEVLWYSLQLKRLGRGQHTRPNESGRVAFVKSLVGSIRGTILTRRLRA
jgi:2,4-dienoyl-CoA reductase-like NADH-dependent reductase (Old Yellow Enzyme family)